MIAFFLPHVSRQFDANFITNVFENEHHIGKVSRVDIVSKHPSYNSVYIHFSSFNTQFAHVRHIVQHIRNGNKISLTYQGKHYWNILKYNNPKNDINEFSNNTNNTNIPFTMKDNTFFSNLVKNQNQNQNQNQN